MITSHGKTRAYYLYVPSTIKASTPVPLIVMLHGSGRIGISLVEKWKDLAKKEDIIIAGPDSTDTRGLGLASGWPGLFARSWKIPIYILVGDNYYDTAAKTNNNAWEFLKKHELESDPIYRKFHFDN